MGSMSSACVCAHDLYHANTPHNSGSQPPQCCHPLIQFPMYGDPMKTIFVATS